MLHESRPRIPITVAIPARNEEQNISRCLERLSQFGEIIVIDSGSTDRTVEIAQEFGARVISFDWNGAFPKKRNWLLLNHELMYSWVLFLDADEFVNDEFCRALEGVVGGNPDAYWIRYTNYFLGTRLKYGIEQRKLALFRVGKALYERIEEDNWSQLDMEVHEHPIVDGITSEILYPIDHRDYKGLAKFIEKHRDYALWESQRYSKLQAAEFPLENLTRRQRFKYRNIDKWWYPAFYFLAAFVLKRGFLDGSAGFYYALYKSWYFLTIRLLIRHDRCN